MILMQEAVDDLTQHLNDAEKEMADWNPVHFENLQQQVDHTQVCLTPSMLFQFMTSSYLWLMEKGKKTSVVSL